MFLYSIGETALNDKYVTRRNKRTGSNVRRKTPIRRSNSPISSVNAEIVDHITIHDSTILKHTKDTNICDSIPNAESHNDIDISMVKEPDLSDYAPHFDEENSNMIIDDNYHLKNEEKETEAVIVSKIKTRQSSCSDMFASSDGDEDNDSLIHNNSSSIAHNATSRSNTNTPVDNTTEVVAVQKENDEIYNISDTVEEDKTTNNVIDDSVFVVPGPNTFAIRKKPGMVLKPGKMYRRSLSLLKQSETIIQAKPCLENTGKCVLFVFAVDFMIKL